jgi:hypothetical protein
MGRENMITNTGTSPGISIRMMLALLMLFGMAGAARATDLLYTGNGFNDGNHGVTIAMELIPEQDIRITDLGVFDGGSDGAGLQVAHDVGLWDTSGTLLATASVDNSATLLSGYRFTPITPVVLSKNQNYILGAYYPAGFPGDKVLATVLTPAPFVSLFSSSRLVGGPALAFPDGTITSTDFRITANLLYEPVDLSRVDISGTVKTTGGLDICAMVLASGQYMFSCNPNGIYSLNNLPRERDGTVKLQIFASGFMPSKTILTGSGAYDVTMTRAGTCPNYNTPYTPAITPTPPGTWIDISGRIALGSNSTIPICSMVLANGQYMFSCAGNGDYSLYVPLDSNGQVTIQVFAAGFAPYKIKIDEFQPVNDILLARASECS